MKIEIIRDLIIGIEISVDSEIFLADKLIIKERMEIANSSIPRINIFLNFSSADTNLFLFVFSWRRNLERIIKDITRNIP